MNKNLTMAALGFTSGLPYMLIFSTLSIWLRDAGIDLTIIGFFAWISLTYSLKFLWSPLVDRYSIPIIKNFGSRKSWIILMQILIIVFLICLSYADPMIDISYLATFAILIALAGSFQDIAIDAFRIELAGIEEQGNLAAYYQFGYRGAILTATSFALIYAENYSWGSAYFLMAALMLIGLVGLTITPERENYERKELSFFENFYEPIKDFIKRFNLFVASILLLIVATYRLTDIVMGPMANPFYIDMGFSLTEIGSIVKIVALVASIIGLFLGGILIKKAGLYRSCLLYTSPSPRD